MNDYELMQTSEFDGADYIPARDRARLSGQIQRVYECMKSGLWWTLPSLEAVTGDPQASISAQMRHLRKPKFGSHTVERVYIKKGLHKYRLILNNKEEQHDQP
jgi:hypothetical protein